MEHDTSGEQDNKLRLFWSVYCLDKGLSLRLGRASTIQDYDISLTPTFNRIDIAELWKSIYTLWITLARIQGKVYELLYSPAALRQPETERVAHARRLAAEMQESVMVPFKVYHCLPWTSFSCWRMLMHHCRASTLSSATYLKSNSSTSNQTKSAASPSSP